MFKLKKLSEIVSVNIKTLFFPLFLAFAVFIFFWFDSYNHELFNFNGRVLGISTLEKVDVKLRISQFYKAIFNSITFFIIFLVVTNVLYKTKRRIRTELLLINYISLIGIFVLVFFVFGQNVESSIYLLVSFIIILILISVFKLLLPKFFTYSDYFFYLWSSMVSLSLLSVVFFFNDVYSVNLFFLSHVLFSFFISLLFSLKFIKIDINLFYKTFKLFIGFPLLIILTQELYLILNQRGIQIFKPDIFFLITVIIIIGATIFLFFKNKRIKVFKNIESTKKFYFSFFVITILFFSHYTPFGKEPNEMFEAANISNSIMNFFHFEKFPVLEFLPTHLVQDLSYGYLYTFLNGYQANFSYEAYHYIYIVLTGLIFYFFFTKITNRYIALVIFLFFPFISTLTWGVKGALFLLVPIILNELYNKTNFKNFILFFIILLIEVSWSPDSGSVSLLIMIIGIAVISILKFERGIIKRIFYAFFIVFIPVISAVYFIGLLKDINVFENIKTALDFYSSSPQARAYPEISREYNSIFIFHHIIFPFLILLISVISIFKIKTLYKRNSFAFISILSLSFFYLLNFQRGLTRHSFYEGNDLVLSSVLFLILGLVVYLLNIKSKILKHSLFIIITTLLILSFKLKSPINGQNVITSLSLKVKNPERIISSDTLIKRFIQKDNSYYIKNDSIISFLKTNLNEESTYFDFSNKPLLYFLTQNKIPVYFLHFLAVTNDNLQEKMLKELKTYDIPFVIFSSYPKTWWDKTDGINNSVRYYKIAEYIYSNYMPYSIINEYSVWKRINFDIIDDSYQQHNIPVVIDTFELKKLPYVWANFDDKIKDTETIQVLNKNKVENNIFNFELSGNFDKSSGNYLEFSINRINKKEDECIVELLSDSISLGMFVFNILNEKDKEKYILRVSSQYNWYSKTINRLRVSFKESNSDVEKIKLLKGN